MQTHERYTFRQKFGVGAVVFTLGALPLTRIAIGAIEGAETILGSPTSIERVQEFKNDVGTGLIDGAEIFGAELVAAALVLTDSTLLF